MVVATRRTFLGIVGSVLAACGLPVRAAPATPASSGAPLRCSVCGRAGTVRVSGTVEMLPPGTMYAYREQWRICPDLRQVSLVTRSRGVIVVVTPVLMCRPCGDAAQAKAAIAPRAYVLPTGQLSLDDLLLDPLLEGLPLKPR